MANSVWTVTAVSGDSVTLSDGKQTRVVRPGQDRAEQHIDLAYAITAHGAQGASETFIAQSGYFLVGFPWYEGNILFAFAVAAQALKWCEQRCLFHSVTVLLLLTAWIPLSGTSYGVAGVLVLVICYRLYRAADTEEHLALAACLVVAVSALNLLTSDVAAAAGLLVTGLPV